MVTPFGGDLRWQYNSFTTSGVSYRAVQTRQMTPSSGAGQYTWNLTLANGSAIMVDTGAGTQKNWSFQTSGAFAGLVSAYEEHGTGGTNLLHKDYVWAQDTAANIYLNSVASTLDPGTSNAAKTTTVQSLDTYGNILRSQIYDYGSSSPTRTYTYQYVTDAAYTSRYIRNRLTYADVNGVVLVRNSYDYYMNSGCIYGLEDRPGLWMHDAAYNASFTARGNLTSSTNIDGTQSLCLDIGGLPYVKNDSSGVSVNLSSTTNTNYSLPENLAPNGNSNLATSLYYTSSFAVNSIVQPNGAKTTTNYDGAGRPLNTTIADGATTNYTYSFNPNTQTATLRDPAGTTRFKRTTYDGFGRPVRVESGHDGTTVSIVDTQYAPCACSPLGKMSKVSQPYAPGGTVYWTSYTYDGSGRTLTVTAPDGSKTTYLYQGNNTTITDPAGKWKKQTVDVFGNLITVTEPNNFVTTYAYTLLNQLTTVTMNRPEGQQTRTFTWSGRDMVQAQNPENGIVKYTYNAAHQVLTRLDAKNQLTQYTYDSYNRLTDIAHFPVAPQWNGDPNHPEDPLQHVHYTYDQNTFDTSFSAQNTWGRLTTVQFNTWGFGSLPLAYEYSYNAAGRVTTQRLQVPVPATPTWHRANFDATYEWDNEGRMTSLAYPPLGPYAPAQPVYAYGYDSMGHLSTMTENGTQVATAGYNWADQMTGMTYDSFSETRTYDPVMMQLSRIVARQGGTTAMDMTYSYTGGQNNGRITSSTDGVLGETVSYTYDSLNRLATAQATNNAWGDSYSYDGFGSLTAVNVTVGSAPHFSIGANPATNGVSGVSYDANGNPNVYGIGYPYDVENRMTSSPTANFGYDPSGKRVTQLDAAGEHIYFYSITGQRLGTYTLSSDGTYFTSTLNLDFGGKLLRSAGVTVATDRLGSVRANSNGERMNYWPYGQERTSTADGREKFGTYFRDPSVYGYTAPDYADQRYYNFVWGRFQTVDPNKGADLGNPTTWNRYAYGGNDPINSYDPTGLCDVMIGGITQSAATAAYVASYGYSDITVFPYASGASGGLSGVFSGVIQVAAQTFGMNNSTTAAVQGLLEASLQGGPINVTTFSGGAAAFTAAVNFLNNNGYQNVTAMIGNVTYVSPGNVGSLYTSASTIALIGNSAVDQAATFFTNMEGIPEMQASECGHDFGCIAKHFAQLLWLRKGEDCLNPLTINQVTSHPTSLSANSNTYGAFSFSEPLADPASFGPASPNPMTSVTSTITYNVP